MKAERVTVEGPSRASDGSVRKMMDNKSIRRTTTVTVGLLSTIWLIDMVDRVMIGLALPMIGDEFSLSSTQLGGVVSVFAIFYMLGQVPRRNVGRPLRTQATVDRCFDPVVGVHSVDRVRVGSRLADGHACDVRHQPGALSSGVVQGFG